MIFFLTPMIFLCNLAFSVLLPLQNLLFKNFFTVILESNHPEFVVIKLSQGGEREEGRGTLYKGLYSSVRKRCLSLVSSTKAIIMVELAIKAHK